MVKDKQGHYQLIEINPRFPAWIYLSLGVERNLPLVLLKLILGEKIETFAEAKAGVLFIRHAVENIVNIADFEAIIMHGGHRLTSS